MTVMGRPQVNFRADPDDIAAWRAAAVEAGTDLSSWLRDLARHATVCRHPRDHRTPKLGVLVCGKCGTILR